MKTIIKFTSLTLLIITFFACSNEGGTDTVEVDKQKPTITINYDNGFPKSCSVLKRGKKYTIKVKVSDNLALASYAIDIHNNFDHHTHDDQGSKCNLDPIKTPVKPFVFMKNYTIKSKPKEYEISQLISIPKDKDIGDYHCQISVTDVTGWQSRTSVDIKIED